MAKDGLNETTIEAICAVLATCAELDKAILYGSRAKGTFRTGSDIDLTLIGSKLTLHSVNKIELAIDELLLPYSFDISIFHEIANDQLLEHIARVGVVFYEKKENVAFCS